MKIGSLLYLTKSDLRRGSLEKNFNNLSITDFNSNSKSRIINHDVVIFVDNDSGGSFILRDRFGSSNNDNPIIAIKETSIIDKLKMVWFSQWLAMNYNDVLNTVTGIWYVEQMDYFNKTVFPNMLKTAIETKSLEEYFSLIKDKK
jgi:hypothetical protein